MSVFNSEDARKLARRCVRGSDLIQLNADIERLNSLSKLPNRKMEVLHGWGKLADQLQLWGELRVNLTVLKAAVKWVVRASEQYQMREALMQKVGCSDCHDLIGLQVWYNGDFGEIAGLHHNGKLTLVFDKGASTQRLQPWVEPYMVAPIDAQVKANV